MARDALTTEQIIEALRGERQLRGWSFRDVGNASGLPQSMVWYYEQGAKKPSIERLRAWADALGYEFVTDLRIKPRPPVAAPEGASDG